MNLNYEKRLIQRGYKCIVGLDEVGRGPLAGPVVACAAWVGKVDKADFTNLKDSKKLTEKQREAYYSFFKKHKEIEWGIGKVSEKMIDRINIFEASKLAMVKAVKKLEKKKKVDLLVLDGNFNIDYSISQKSFIKGDERILSVAVASIIAKVTRDRIMVNYHKKYPKYCFDRHKGYPTKLHRKRIMKYGPLAIHRKSFSLI